MARSGYQANYRGRQTLVWADGPNEAQSRAATFFRAKSPREVVVRLTVRAKAAPTESERRANTYRRAA